MYEEELAFAHDARRRRRRRSRWICSPTTGLEIRHKADRTLVTAADTAIERMVRARLEAAFPERPCHGRGGGRHVRRRRPRVDRRPDRRHRQLRPRDPGVGDADRAAGRRRSSVVGVAERAGAGRALRGGPGRGRHDERQADPASATSSRLADAQFLYSQLDTLLGGAHGSATLELLADARTASEGSATSGGICWWRAVQRRSASSRRSRSGTSRRSSRSSRRRAGGSPTSRAPPAAQGQRAHHERRPARRRASAARRADAARRLAARCDSPAVGGGAWRAPRSPRRRPGRRHR